MVVCGEGGKSGGRTCWGLMGRRCVGRVRGFGAAMVVGGARGVTRSRG